MITIKCHALKKIQSKKNYEKPSTRWKLYKISNMKMPAKKVLLIFLPTKTEVLNDMLQELQHETVFESLEQWA